MVRNAVNIGGPGSRRLGFSDAVRVPAAGSMLFVSGVTSRDSDGAVVGVDDPMVQMRCALERLDRVVREGGAERDDVVQVRVLVRNIDHWSTMESTFDRFWGAIWPACTLFEVSGLFDDDLLVEIEAVAAVPATDV